MYKIFLILAIILGLIFQKSKLITLYQVTVCSLLFSFNIENPDYSGYYGTYYSASQGGIYKVYLESYGFLYQKICELCNKWNFSFNQFRLFVFLLCILLIISTILKITRRINFVLSLYIIFPLCMDCIQIRNFIGESIVIFSSRYLLYIDEKKQIDLCNLVKYIITIFIASLFHSVTIIYLLYIILFFKKNFKYFYICEIAGVTLLSFNIAVGLLPQFSNIIYFTTRVSGLTFIFLSGLTCSLIYLLHYIFCVKKAERNLPKYFMTNFVNFFNETTIFIPLLIFHFDMFRFIRNILIIFSAAAGRYIDIKQQKYNTSSLISINTLIIMLALITIFLLLLFRSAYYAYDIPLTNQMINSINFVW